ncbi:MAG: SUMF1/EgtB/PvdO family nonheme iron enzyme [Planctomycetota bacterium]
MNQPPKVPQLSPESPWLGLRPFLTDNRHYFYGRSSEIEELAERVFQRRLTVLYGRSGLGKTSLLRAGIIPQLNRDDVLVIYLRLAFHESAASLEQQVVNELLKHLPGETDQEADTKELWELLHDPQFGFVDETGRVKKHVVFAFDQFEEVHTQGEAKRAEDVVQFMDMLSCVVENRCPHALLDRLIDDSKLAERLMTNAQPAKVLVSLRDDFLFWLERWRTKMPSLLENRFELLPLSGLEAVKVVEGPANKRCRKDAALPPIVDRSTAETIVKFVAGAPSDSSIEEITNVPPLLNLVCEQLNRSRLQQGAQVIDREQVRGQAQNVLSNFYVDSLNPYPDAVKEFVEDELLSASGFRESMTVDSAVARLEHHGVTDPKTVLDQLVEQRLLTVDDRGGVARLELTHDVLAPVAHASKEKRLASKAVRDRAKTTLKRIAYGAAVIVATVILGSTYLLYDLGKKAMEAKDQLAAEQLELQKQTELLTAAKRESEANKRAAEKAKDQAIQDIARAERDSQKKIAAANDEAKLMLRKIKDETESRIAAAQEQSKQAEARVKDADAKLKEVEKKTGTLEESLRQASMTQFLAGLDSWEDELSGDQFTKATRYPGKSKMNEAIAHWCRALEIDPENYLASNAVFSLLSDRSHTEFGILKTESWGIPVSINATLSPKGDRAMFQQGTGIRLVGASGFKADLTGDEAIKDFRFTQTGRYVLAQFGNLTSVVFDASTGKKLFEKSFEGKLVSHCVSETSGRLIVVTKQRNNGKVDLFDISNGSKVGTIDGYDQPIYESSLVEDGFVLFRKDQSTKNIVLELRSFKRTGQVDYFNVGVVDGDLRFASSERSSSGLVIQSENFSEIIQFQERSRLEAFPDFAQGQIRFSPAGNAVLCFGKRLECFSGSNVTLARLGPNQSISFIPLMTLATSESNPAFSTDGAMIAINSNEGEIEIWNVANGSLRQRFMPVIATQQVAIDLESDRVVLLGIDNLVRYAAISGAGQNNVSELLLATQSGPVDIRYDRSDGAKLARVGDRVIRFETDGNWQPDSVKRWDRLSKWMTVNGESSIVVRKTIDKLLTKTELVVTQPATEGVRVVTALPGDARILGTRPERDLVLVGAGKKAFVWNYKTNQQIGTELDVGEFNQITDGKFNSDGSLILLSQQVDTKCSSFVTSLLYEVGNNEAIASFGPTLSFAKFFEDTDQIIVCNTRGVVWVADSKLGRPQSVPLQTNQLFGPNQIFGLQGKLYVSEADGIRVWDPALFTERVIQNPTPPEVVKWCEHIAGIRVDPNTGLRLIDPAVQMTYFATQPPLAGEWATMADRFFEGVDLKNVNNQIAVDDMTVKRGILPQPNQYSIAKDIQAVALNVSETTNAQGLVQSTLTNSVGIQFSKIASGEYSAGRRETDQQLLQTFRRIYRYAYNENPMRALRVNRDFYVSTKEVTIGQFEEFVKDTKYKTQMERGEVTGQATGVQIAIGADWRKPGSWKVEPDHPVTNVTYNDAVEFCNWLSRQEGRSYRLPFDDEWEYFARAGAETRYWNGNDPNDLWKIANVPDQSMVDAEGPRTPDLVRGNDWIEGNDKFPKIAPVGSFPANPWGLHDIHGNVWEWCTVSNPVSLEVANVERLDIAVIRGGCFY